MITEDTAPAAALENTVDTGNHCDNCTTVITLPFTFRLYDRAFTTALIGSNGTLGFVSNPNLASNICLPTGRIQNMILPHWDDLDTSQRPGFSGPGVYTQVEGRSPSRQFHIDWYAYNKSSQKAVEFILTLYENSPTQRFTILYIELDALKGGSATVGVEEIYNSETGNGRYTQYPDNTQCNQPALDVHLLLIFDYLPCGPQGTPVPRSGAVSAPPADGRQGTPGALVSELTSDFPAAQGGNLVARDIGNECLIAP